MRLKLGRPDATNDQMAQAITVAGAQVEIGETRFCWVVVVVGLE